jgi:SP family general alpha glucoside:H+ symporter-like MFS transporter
MGRFGRRTIYLIGQALMATILGTIGILGCVPQSQGVSYGIGALMLLLNLTFASTVGPTCYTIVGELPSAQVRAPTIVLARTTYVLSGIVNAQITPRMLSTGDWNWGAKCGFFFLGTNIISFIYCYFRLPESLGISSLPTVFQRAGSRPLSSQNLKRYKEMSWREARRKK